MVSLSVVYCTYNRCQVFDEVLETLFQAKNIENVEIVIVDNNSTDQTKNIVSSYAGKYQNIKYVFESKQGLSVARNRGFKEARGSYVMYLDDDALVPNDLFIKVANILTDQPHIEALGGAYKPWYREYKPKWYDDLYVSKLYEHNGTKPLVNDTWTGCIMLIKKDILDKYSFDETLGMTGKKVFYGEETDLQYRLKNNNVLVYATNDLLVRHLVHDYKLNLKWFFKRRAAQAQSMALINNGNRFLEVVKGIFIGLGLALKDTLFNLPKLFRKGYYKENFIIDSYTKPYKWWVYALENIKG